MKSFLRFLLVLLGVIVVGILVLAIIEPKDCTVQRSMVINAPKTAVFDKIVHFKDWPHWSPWYQMDTTAQLSYFGTDGTQGSGYHWVGDSKKTGEGEMTNTGVAGTKMMYALHFIKPFSGNAEGSFTVADTANGQSVVTWSITLHHPFPMNAMNAFVNMDKMLGGDFNRGLENLKKYAESNPATTTGITEVDIPAMTYAGVRKTIVWNDMEKFYMESFGMLGKTVKPIGNAASLFYKWDTVNHNADVAAVFPVSDTTPHTGITYFHVPAGKGYVAMHMGGYSSIGKEHSVLMQYVAGKNQQITLVMEEYIVGHFSEPDSAKWQTKITYLVK